MPAAVVDETIEALTQQARERATSSIDGGNSHYVDDIRRADALKAKGIHYVDAGTSGGVWGLERGYCLMIGGEPDVVRRLDPIFATLAPSASSVSTTPARAATTDTRAPRNAVTFTAGQAAQATSSRWFTTESSTASWRPMRRA